MAVTSTRERGVRLAEPVAALSLATDLGMGQPMEHALRRCLLAVRLGEVLGLSDRQLRDVYYVGLVCSVGCTVKLQGFAPWFTDEIAAAAQAATLNPRWLLDEAKFLIRVIGEGQPPLRRAGTVASALAFGRREVRRSSAACYEVCRSFGDMLGLEPSVIQALGQMHERWDGLGEPARLKGEEKALASRIAHLAGDAEIFYRLGGIEGATGVVRQRSGKVYDPEIAGCFCREAPQLLAGIDAESVWDSVLGAEPAPQQWLNEDQLDSFARALAHFADVKSAYTLSHSTGVAALAEGAARVLGLPETDVATLRRAGYLHDLGRIGVPLGIWDKEAPLTQAEWERVRMHPYLTERVLARSPSLARLGALAALHHERLDGSGYHQGVTASAMPIAARILAVSDFFHAKIEPRPHRPALTPQAAADEVHREVHEGRLDKAAAAAVLSAAGFRGTPGRRALPAGLSDREVEVLRLIAQGRSVRQMAAALGLSPKTVDHHVQHIYAKIGVSTRVAATLFAMRHDLLTPAT